MKSDVLILRLSASNLPKDEIAVSRELEPVTNPYMKSAPRTVVLGYFAYNFTKIHCTLRVTPAMPAGVTDRPWESRT